MLTSSCCTTSGFRQHLPVGGVGHWRMRFASIAIIGGLLGSARAQPAPASPPAAAPLAPAPAPLPVVQASLTEEEREILEQGEISNKKHNLSVLLSAGIGL